MKAAIVLLANTPIQNYLRRIVFELNTGYQVAFFGSLLPSHVSLKQPFAFEDMDVLEKYFDGLAARTPPFDLQLDRFYYEEWAGFGILGLNVVETPILRGLHNQLNDELGRLFKETRAAHDGSEYHFHMTIELGKVEGANPFKTYYDGLANPQVNFTYRVSELALFYYMGEVHSAGTFINYRVMPLGG
jgi:2'-5' RNA ligase